MRYQYTYDLRQDYQGRENLTSRQQELMDHINEQVRDAGGDRHDALHAASASADDKAALAELWGGPGAGAEFLR